MRWIALIIIFLMPLCLAQSSYNRFPECRVDSDNCLSFDADPVSDTISFSFKTRSFISSPERFSDYEITSVSMRSNSCRRLTYGLSADTLSTGNLSFYPGQEIFVHAEGCGLRSDVWWKSRVQIEYSSNTVDPYSGMKRQLTSSGTINIFLESADYQANQKMDRYLWRYMPLLVLAALGVIGFHRVKRC
jgi:hypothetical protein